MPEEADLAGGNPVDLDHGRPRRAARLGEDALERIAASLSDLYAGLYGEPPVDPRASLTGNMLAFVFEGGLSIADERLLTIGKGKRLSTFRTQFFEVASDRMVAVVGELTGLAVTYSFFGFDPQTRTTHAIFVLDLSGLDESDQRQAVLNWGEQVRRNARRLRAEHVATRQVHHELAEQVRRSREELGREVGEPEGTGASSDD